MGIQSASLNVMRAAAEKAGRALRRDFGEIEKLQVSQKGPGDFVTNADLKAESIIREELQTARPGYGLLMEESGEIEGSDKTHRWIVDPLDGTTNFMHGIPHFAISIALEREGRLVAGLIYNPVTDEMFFAEKNNGAFFNNQRIRVSKKNKIDDCLFGSNLHGVKKVDLNLRVSGSAALDLAYVAAGRLDGFFQKKLNIWDVAAGIILIREAGGIINDFDVSKIKNHTIIAGSETIYKEISTLLKNF